MKLEELNDTNLGTYLLKGNEPTVLAFYASWSKPARTMLQVVEDVAEAYGEMVRFAVVDTDHAQDALNRYGILNLPTFLIFRNGELVDRFIGLLTKEKLTERIETSLARI